MSETTQPLILTNVLLGDGTVVQMPIPQGYSDALSAYKAIKVDAEGMQLIRVVGGADPATVALQSAATAAGNGTAFAPTDGNYVLTFEITGDSTSREVAFELAGPSGTYIAHDAFNVTDPTKYGSTTTGGSNTTPEIWQVEVPAGCSFRARINSVAGGSVTITGKAVRA